MEYEWTQKSTGGQVGHSPRIMKNILVLLGFRNLYWILVRLHSKKVQLLAKVMKKHNLFCRGDDQKRVFVEPNKVFSKAQVLVYVDYDKEIVLQTDEPNYVSVVVLYQYEDQGILDSIEMFGKHIYHRKRIMRFITYNLAQLSVL